MTQLRTLLLSAALVSISGSAAAQCLDYVEGFGPTGMDGAVKAIAVFDAGNGPEIYAGGQFQNAGGELVNGVARLEGSRWRPLSPAVSGSCGSLAVYDDGSGPALFIGGLALLDIDGVPSGYLVRWNGVTADVPGGGPNAAVTALEVFDGAGTGPLLYAAGYFNQAGGTLTGNVARWNGSQWSSLGGTSPGVQGGNVLCLHAGADSIGPALFAGGSFTGAGGIAAPKLARYDGSQWSAVSNISLSGDVLAVTTWNSPAGPRLVAGGRFIVSGTNVSNIGEWNGTTWSNMAGGTYIFSPFPNPPHPWVYGLSVLDTGNGPRVFATGTFVAAGGAPASRIAAWNGTAWSTLGSGLLATDQSWQPNGYVLETIDLGTGPRLHVGGQFVRAGSALANGIAAFDGTQFESLGSGSGLAQYDSAKVMTSFDDGSGEALWIAGTTSGAGPIGQFQGAVRFDGQTWTAAPLDGMYVSTFATHDDGVGTQLYVGGGAGDGECVLRWDGANWNPLPGGPPPVASCSALCSFDDGNGVALYMGSPSGAGFYRWKNQSWSAITPSPFGITNLVVFDDGNGPALFAGGFFDGSVAPHAQSVARFDGTTWSSVGFPEAPPGAGSNVTSMVVHDDGGGSRLYVGGWFHAGLYRFDGSAWFSFNLGATKVNALATFDEGTGHAPALYIANGLGLAGSQPVSHLLRWDGSALDEVGSGLTGGGVKVQALSVFDDGTTRSLFVGGRFSNAGVHDSEGIARMDACGQTGEVFCLGDGTSGACPCGNASAPSDRAGCRNSFGIGGVLRARGRMSLSGDTASLDGSAMTNSTVLYVQGAQAAPGSPFGDGIKCTNGPYVRLGTRTNVAGVSSFPGGSGPSLSVKGQVFFPGTRYYQARYRNAAAFCTTDTFNYTNGVVGVWVP